MWEEKLFIAVPEGPETFVKKSAEDLDLLLCSTFVHKQVWLLSSLKNTEGYFHLVQGKNRVNSTSLWSWSGSLPCDLKQSFDELLPWKFEYYLLDNVDKDVVTALYI